MVPSHARTPDVKGRIIIQEGDTLWKLALTYDVSVDQLRDWNNIYTDLIMTGFHIQVAEPKKAEFPFTEQVHVQPNHFDTPSEEPLPHVVRQAPIQPPVDSHAALPSEPTHILSIATPQPDTHESP